MSNERQRAWDLYAAHAIAAITAQAAQEGMNPKATIAGAANLADLMLEERDRRWKKQAA